jgi:hypothetical protein
VLQGNIEKELFLSKVNSGGPRLLEQVDLDAEVTEAENLGADEALHSRDGLINANEPGPAMTRQCFMTEADIKILRDKHVFLRDFSDAFIKNTSIGDDQVHCNEGQGARQGQGRGG